MFNSSGHARSYVGRARPRPPRLLRHPAAQRGYRALVRSGQGRELQQVWEGDHGRVVLQLEQALGGTDLTRIRISVGESGGGVASAGSAGGPGPVTNASGP